jgi:hypothetical protein
LAFYKSAWQDGWVQKRLEDVEPILMRYRSSFEANSALGCLYLYRVNGFLNEYGEGDQRETQRHATWLDTAVQHFERALQIKPDSFEVYQHIEQAQRWHHRDKESVAAAYKSLQLHPSPETAANLRVATIEAQGESNKRLPFQDLVDEALQEARKYPGARGYTEFLLPHIEERFARSAPPAVDLAQFSFSVGAVLTDAGHIVVDSAAVKEGSSISVYTFPWIRRKARVLAVDPDLRLALLKTDVAYPIACLPVQREQPLRPILLLQTYNYSANAWKSQSRRVALDGSPPEPSNGPAPQPAEPLPFFGGFQINPSGAMDAMIISKKGGETVGEITPITGTQVLGFLNQHRSELNGAVVGGNPRNKSDRGHRNTNVPAAIVLVVADRGGNSGVPAEANAENSTGRKD